MTPETLSRRCLLTNILSLEVALEEVQEHLDQCEAQQ